ncbi:MAG: glycosyltransferase family 39 protein [Candidatus Omnitrophota bacterium]
MDSPTYDEVGHISNGYSYVITHDFRLGPEHPPLLKNLSGLTLLAADKIFRLKIHFPLSSASWNNHDQFSFAKKFLFFSGNNADAIVFFARLPFLFLMVIFGIYLFLFTRKYFGENAALLATFFYGLSPNIIAHGRLMTTDFGVSFFMFISLFYFIDFLKNPTWKNSLKVGFVLGLTFLTKFSAIVLLPVFTVVWLSFHLVQHGWNREFFRQIHLKKWVLIFLMVSIIIWLVYYWNIFRMPQSYHDNFIKEVFCTKYTTAVQPFFLFLNHTVFLRPFSYFLFGPIWTSMTLKGMFEGHPFIWGHFVSGGFRHLFFPLTYVLKEPLSFLVLFFTVIYSIGFSIIKNRFGLLRKPRDFCRKVSFFIKNHPEEFTLLTFILFYWFIAIATAAFTGIRHILPVLPLTYVLISQYLFTRFKHFNKPVFVFLLIWYFGANIYIYPSYLAYSNEIAGGPKNGYKILTDANVDWGQDLKRLAEYLEKNHFPTVNLDYFGMAEPAYYLGTRYIPYQSDKNPPKGLVAVSVTNYHKNRAYRWFSDKKPVAVIGYSILVYRI